MNKSNWALTLLLAMNAAMIGPAVSEGLADPTRPNSWAQVLAPAAVTQEAPTFALESIIYSPSRRVAVINGRTLAEGESLGSLTLLKVDRRQVTVRIDKQRRVLLLKPISDVRR